MKNRRTFLSLFVLASLAFVGVGYASLTNTLTIGGTASATKNDDNLKVEFVASKAHTKDAEGNEDTGFIATHSVSGKTASMSVSNINEVGSYAEFVYVVRNNSPELDGASLDAVLDSKFDIKVSAGTTTNAQEKESASTTDNVFEGDHFTISAEYATSHPDFTTTGEDATYEAITIEDENRVYLEVGKVVFVVVTVELTTPININDSSNFDEHTITVTFNATTPTAE